MSAHTLTDVLSITAIVIALSSMALNYFTWRRLKATNQGNNPFEQ